MMQFHAVLIRILAADSVKKFVAAVIRTCDRQGCNCMHVVNDDVQLQP